MDQQPLHQVGCQPQECCFFVRAARRRRTQGFDLYQLEIELMYQRGWLKGVIATLGAHTRGGNAPELRIENLNQLPSRCPVAIAETRHQAGYGVGLQRGWDRQLEPILPRSKKTCR